MADLTPLDAAHTAMQAGDDVSRLRFYERLADTELFVSLETPASGDHISPETFETEEGRFVLVFDLEERLAQFKGPLASQATLFASMSGRVLMQMLGGQGIGLALNPDVAPSSILIPADAVEWLNHTLAQAPDRVVARIKSYLVPTGLPDGLTAALAQKLTNAGGLAKMACLVGVTYQDGSAGLLLGFVGATQRAEPALAKAAGEALVFTGSAAGMMDVGFFAGDDPVVAKMTSVGICLELAVPDPQAAPVRPAPGSDPKRPPKLR